MIEDRNVLRRVVRPEQVRDATDALRAEARPDAESSRRIKGSSDYRSVAILKIPGVWQSHESAHPAETWALKGVGRFVARHMYLPYGAGMQPLPRRYNAIHTLYDALSAPTVGRINIVDKRYATPANMDANATSRVQPARIWPSKPGSTRKVEEMLAYGARACGWG